MRRIFLNFVISISLGAYFDNAWATTFTFSPTGYPVINPGKGWISYGRPSSKSDIELSLVSVGYERFEWSAIQPAKGRFNWGPIDDFIDSWYSQGKKAAFGVMTANSHGRAGVSATPQWVFDEGAPKHIELFNNGGDIMRGTNGIFVSPSDYHDPVFLRSLENFLEAFSIRYDGDPRIAFIDIRSFENWGEGFSKAHLNLYRKHFKHTILVQSSKTESDAFWIASSGVGIRRDGIGGSVGAELRPGIGKVVTVGEFWGPLSYLKAKNWWRDGNLLKDLISLGRPTYIEFIRGSPEFGREYLSLINSITNQIGFNFHLSQATFPTNVKLADDLPIVSEWLNTGQQPIFYPCYLIVGLFSQDWSIAKTFVASDVAPARWMPGENSIEYTRLRLNGLKSGKYYVGFALSESKSNLHPAYKIDSKGLIHNNWLIVGQLLIN